MAIADILSRSFIIYVTSEITTRNSNLQLRNILALIQYE